MKFAKYSIHNLKTSRLPSLHPSQTIQSLFPSSAPSEIINSAVISELFTAKEWNGTPFVRVSVRSSQSHIKLDSMIWLSTSAANPAKSFFNDKHYDGYRLRFTSIPRRFACEKLCDIFAKPLESSTVWSVTCRRQRLVFACCLFFFYYFSSKVFPRE